MREAELDDLPSDTAQAIRQLADYEWQSPAARETFEQLKSLLRSEVLDSQFAGMRQALSNPDPQALQRVKDATVFIKLRGAGRLYSTGSGFAMKVSGDTVPSSG